MRRATRRIGVLFALECALAAANAAMPDVASRVDREIGQAVRWVGASPTRAAVARANRDIRWLARRAAVPLPSWDAPPPTRLAEADRGPVANLPPTLHAALYGALFRSEIWLWAVARSWWLSGAVWLDAWGVGRAWPAATPLGAFRRRRAVRWLAGGYLAATSGVLQWPWMVHPLLPTAMAWLALPVLWLALRNVRGE